jgi:hypothetical protein
MHLRRSLTVSRIPSCDYEYALSHIRFHEEKTVRHNRLHLYLLHPQPQRPKVLQHFIISLLGKLTACFVEIWNATDMRRKLNPRQNKKLLSEPIFP